jgi:hypothetical protein
MESISSIITISKGEMRNIISIDCRLEVELVEEREEGNRVGLWADSAVVVANGGVCYLY